MTSGTGRTHPNVCSLDPAELLGAPLARAEFLAVDTETNGLARERCELTEVGTVLVGGGELHERWDSLVGVSAPLSPGIQRFTGITQGMLDGAPPPEVVLPRLARLMRGRVLVAHNARFDAGVLRQAFNRAGLDYPNPPVLCTVALARKLAPLQKKRGLATLADALGVEVGVTHRALPDAELCAQVFCALFKRLCANAGTVADAVELLGPRKRSPRPRQPKLRMPVERRPDLRELPRGPGVYVFRDADGHPLYVGKSVDVRTRARSHFTGGAPWTAHAESVDCEPTESDLGALLLEHRLIRALKPPANVKHVRDADGQVYLRCRLDIAFPVLEVAREPAAGNAVCIGPVHGRAAAAELIEQLNSLFGLRHCGRKLPSRQWPSAYGQMGRCLSPCLGDLDPNLYRERLELALRPFVDSDDGASALLDHVDRQFAAAVAEQRYEAAEVLRRRRERLATLLSRLGGVVRAVHAGARLVIAPHPSARGRGDALWIVRGRVVDRASLPAARDEVAERTDEALKAAGLLPPLTAAGGGPGVAPALPRRRDLGSWLAPDELQEVRIVGGWLAANPARTLELEPAPSRRRVEGFLAAALA